MSQPAIQVRGLGKQYLSGTRGPAYETLRDSLMQGLGKLRHGVTHRLRGKSRKRRVAEWFWALEDITFDVQQGEVIGLIGRNGAGKSTLLKVLSRITPPTTGEIRLRGRVGSLLEVGTGFHAELTGRENIYLSGAILGMQKAEIDRKLDQIVEFAEVARFLDTPLKRYSTGMYLRLAFAVAAHLETEILLVDEVLAVGDAEFRRRCLGLLDEIGHGGRTVIFVSHNMAMIEALCSRTLLLNGGHLIEDGPTIDVVRRYLERPAARTREADLSALPRTRGLIPHLMRGELENAPLAAEHTVLPRMPLHIRLGFRLPRPTKGLAIGIHFENAYGSTVLATNTRWHRGRINLPAGDHEAECVIESLPLVPGHYTVTVYLYGNSQTVDRLDQIAHLEVTAADVYGSGELPYADQGFFLTEANWSIQASEPSLAKR